MTKQQIIEALEILPDDATYEDAIERLSFLQKLKERIERLDEGGHTLSPDEVKAHVAKWLK